MTVTHLAATPSGATEGETPEDRTAPADFASPVTENPIRFIIDEPNFTVIQDGDTYYGHVIGRVRRWADVQYALWSEGLIVECAWTDDEFEEIHHLEIRPLGEIATDDDDEGIYG